MNKRRKVTIRYIPINKHQKNQEYSNLIKPNPNKNYLSPHLKSIAKKVLHKCQKNKILDSRIIHIVTMVLMYPDLPPSMLSGKLSFMDKLSVPSPKVSFYKNLFMLQVLST